MNPAGWPTAELDEIARLHVLAAAVPGAVVTTCTLDAPFDAAWAVASDLEDELPRYLPDVRSMRITASAPDRFEGRASGYLGLRARFDIVLRPGWCVMRSRLFFGAMAAVPDGDRTRFAFLTGAHVPGQRAVAPVLTTLGRWAGPRIVARFAQRVEQRMARFSGTG